ncbi:MAG: PEP-CTERM sorting domain-containing protein [Microcystaceae cyanobacterium]
MNNIKSAKTQALSLGTSALTLATILSSVNVANAATFDFTIVNTNVASPFTSDSNATGTIELPDAALTTDGVYTASSVVITGLSTTPAPSFLDDVIGLNFAPGASTNSFEVVSNQIVQTADTALISVLGNFTLFINGDQGNASLLGNGAPDPNESIIGASVFGEGVKTPEPSTLLGLLAVGSLGALTRKRK